ncbi:nucleotidyltransferase domain-containing protein [Arsenicicoccus sp. oral taxon 190]|uniref:nucleotidyltransferase domain-containing protein n=1 Tax=Arsenicicoccus sp. oral taxon 190 TaxID=1658671 RepID=UPI00209EF18D|nr:nucleotidyltransferase domain-containing protein [Arsenicicoccus sp. oral taxon 190]
MGVTLGGSRARGTHHAGSDVDLGVYYEASGSDSDSMSLDLAALQRVASAWSDEPAPVAGPGGWGPWVDGGAWLTVAGTPVDLILRSLARVAEQTERALRAELAFHPQPGHPLGFLDVSYAGELVTARVLADPDGALSRLRSRLGGYPAPLRDALVEAAWEADFLCTVARKALPREDVTYVALCLARALMLCAHAWHARAGAWVTNEKDLVPGVARLPLDTRGFTSRAAAALSRCGPGRDELARAIDEVEALVQECRSAGRRSGAGPACGGTNRQRG